MNTAVINIKTDAKTKRDAQKLADDFGVSLSSLVTMTLRNLSRTKRLDISLIPEEEPTEEEIEIIKMSEEAIKKREYTPLSELCSTKL